MARRPAVTVAQKTASPSLAALLEIPFPTNKDVPQLDCILLDFPDPIINEYGARGIGEIGLTGVASALTSAVYHATGVRIRELPIRIEDVLQSQVSIQTS